MRMYLSIIELGKIYCTDLTVISHMKFAYVPRSNIGLLQIRIFHRFKLAVVCMILELQSLKSCVQCIIAIRSKAIKGWHN